MTQPLGCICTDFNVKSNRPPSSGSRSLQCHHRNAVPVRVLSAASLREQEIDTGELEMDPPLGQVYVDLKIFDLRAELILIVGSETQGHCLGEIMHILTELKVAEVEIPPSFIISVFRFKTVKTGRAWSHISVQHGDSFAKSVRLPIHLAPLAKVPESCSA